MKSDHFSFVCICCLLLLVFLSGCGGSSGSNENNPPPTGEQPGEPVLFMDANFRATHNSYSGNINDGHRGSVIQQLDLGLRYLEIDIVFYFFFDEDDFHVGHNADDGNVDHGHGNPSTHSLRDWLTVINDWSGDNPQHAPIVIAIEGKDNFLQSDNFTVLNTLVHDIFGDKVVKTGDFDPATATYASVKGKIFVVSLPKNSHLSGDKDYIFKGVDFHDDYNQDARVFNTMHSGDSKAAEFVKKIRKDKKSIRLAFFDNPDYRSLPVPNYPSYDNPYWGWYATYSETITETHPDDTNDTEPYFPKITKVVPDFQFSKVAWDSNTTIHNVTSVDVDVAVNASGRVVEVHKSPLNNDLFYRVGQLSDGQIAWFSTEAIKFDTGLKPSVAINDNNIVVEVHEANNDNDDLYYRVGTVDAAGAVTWGASTKYDTGDRPSVAINKDNMVVEVHKDHETNNLWYNVGKVKVDIQQNPNGTIAWGSKDDYRNYETGKNPSVAMYDNYILEAHNSGTDYLWCRIGTLDAFEKKILWRDSREDEHKTYSYAFEGEGNVYPDVAFNGSSAVAVQRYSEEIRFRPGKPNNTVMAWGARDTVASSTSSEPSVAMNKNYVLLFYSNSTCNLKYRLGTLSQ